MTCLVSIKTFMPKVVFKPFLLFHEDTCPSMVVLLEHEAFHITRYRIHIIKYMIHEHCIQ